jgi:hypothetical protein
MYRITKTTIILAIIIAATLATTATCFAQAPSPLLVTNKTLGGGPLNQYPPGVTGGVGLNNIGLLVKTCGTVTYLDPVNKFFYIDDGSALNDLSGLVGAVGVRVSYAGLASGNTFNPPTINNFVIITGISSTVAITVGQQTRIAPLLRPRSDSDKTVVF